MASTSEPNPFTGPHELELPAWISCAPFEASLGIEILQAENGQATLTMPFTANLAQGSGLMHGGALCALADTALAMATKTLIPPYSHFGTISMSAQILRPVKRGWVRAEARVTHRLERELHGEVEVSDDAGTTVYRFLAVNKLARNTELRNVTFNEEPDAPPNSE